MVARRAPFWPLLRFFQKATRKRWWTEIKPLLLDRRLSARIAATQNQGSASPPLLFQMATGFWLSQAIYVAAKLGIPDLLKDGPQSCVALTASTHSDSGSLYRLMRALSSVGIFKQLNNGLFALSDVGQNLRTDVHGSLRHMVITLGEIHYQACGDLLHSVQTGSPAFDQLFGEKLFDYLRQSLNAADAFHRGMANVSSILAYAVLMAYDFAGISSIIDIGGGLGEFLEKILQFNPAVVGTVFDTPSTIEGAKQRLRNTACARRCLYVAGDFFASVPKGADAYLLCGVIHDWDDSRAVTILKKCREAMMTNGRLLLVDMVLPEGPSASFIKLLDLNMLVMTGGRERTEAEFADLLDDAGYKLTRIISTMAPQNIVEARPMRL
jgi:O-methyltransferase domain/Dimerisation domain